jgi:hypothetical protein
MDVQKQSFRVATRDIVGQPLPVAQLRTAGGTPAYKILSVTISETMNVQKHVPPR